jgi:hypothetical protein
MTCLENPPSAASLIAANKELYRRWFEKVVTGGDLSLADELLAPGYRLPERR